VEHDEDRHEYAAHTREDHALLAVLVERVGSLTEQVKTLTKEVEKYTLLARFTPVERGFYWLSGLIGAAVVAAVLSKVLH